MPGAQILLTHELTGVRQSTSSDMSGAFVFPNVLPGPYAITVTAAGFKQLEKKGFILDSSARLPVGAMTLEVGSGNESVTVTALAVPVQTASHERSAVVNDRQLAYLSTLGRDVMNLLKVLLGVLRRYYGYGNINYMEFASNSSYHSLQTQLKKSFSRAAVYRGLDVVQGHAGRRQL